jgi:hypothetical protein
MPIRSQQFIRILKHELYIGAKGCLLCLCAFVIGALITIPLFALLHVTGWLEREDGAWACTNEDEEFIFKIIFVFSFFLGSQLIFYLLKLFSKRS